MVQKNNKWNISKEKGEEYAHRYIIEILKDSKNNTLGLSELIILLNQRTKHINLSMHKKKKPISVYLKHVYGRTRGGRWVGEQDTRSRDSKASKRFRRGL